MEVALPPAQHGGLHAAFGPNPFGGIGGDGRFSSSLSSLGGDRFCGYSTTTTTAASSRFGNSPVLSSPSPRAASLSRGSSESGSVVDDGDDAAAAVAERRLRLERLALQYQEVVNRFELCLSYLADASNEAAALRRENDELRGANEDLTRRINIVGARIVDEFSGLRLAEEHITPPPPPPPPAAVPLPAAPVMPKSISVRSPGYLMMNQNRKRRGSKPKKVSQRLFVGMDGGVRGEEEHKGVEEKKLNGGLEFEVYNQGMLKTELCNKWEETGVCPYGDQCQFAHGVAELRPVIRHPRYKTQVQQESTMDVQQFLLSELNTDTTKRAAICVRVMRKWIFDANKQNGPILRYDLVLADKEGNAIYAEIPQRHIEAKAGLLEMDEVYNISRFVIRRSKPTYRPFDAAFMIEFTAYTLVSPAEEPKEAFPSMIYNIKLFSEIETLAPGPPNYVDTIGAIVSVKPLSSKRIRGNDAPSQIREVTIQDLKGENMLLTLWGDKAANFSVDDVYNPAAPAPIVVLFVGCIPKVISNSETNLLIFNCLQLTHLRFNACQRQCLCST